MRAQDPVDFHVRHSATTLRDGFPYFAHHDSVSALWARKWRPLCAAGAYPFEEGDVADFDPIFDELITESGDDTALLRRPDDWARPFLPVAATLADRAGHALGDGDDRLAAELELRAAAVYRIARFPINRSPAGEYAWRQGVAAYERGGRSLDPPHLAVDVPFTHADPSVGDRRDPIRTYLRLPEGPVPDAGWPLVLFVCGLDAYRTDHAVRTRAHVTRGFATLSFEIPGTGDCPAAPHDPTSPDRLLSSVLAWALAGDDHRFDPATIVVRGISTGGYYALRAAHTHADMLFAAVSHGGGAHYMFDTDWVHAQNQMEYPFALADALAYKFGFRGNDPAVAVDRYAAEASARFSLRETGVLDTPSCRVLAVNGREDTIFPVEDSILATSGGAGQDLIVVGGQQHMGGVDGERALLRWLDDRIDER